MERAKEAAARYVEEGLLALVPVYADGGNACRIYTGCGDYLDAHSLQWLLSRVAAYHGTGVKLLHQVYGPVLGRRNTIPLPLSREVLLLPLKMREARVAGDTTIGYVNGHRVTRVEPAPAPYRSTLHLREGLTLESFTTPATARERLLQGQSVYREFLRRRKEPGASAPYPSAPGGPPPGPLPLSGGPPPGIPSSPGGFPPAIPPSPGGSLLPCTPPSPGEHVPCPYPSPLPADLCTPSAPSCQTYASPPSAAASTRKRGTSGEAEDEMLGVVLKTILRKLMETFALEL